MKLLRFLIVPVVFLMLTGLSPVATGQVNQFGVSKTAYFLQDSDATPRLDAGNNHYFDAWVEDSGQSEIDSATVTTPSGGGIDLLPILYFFQGFTSQSTMDATFKNGSYTFNVTTVDLDFFFAQLSLMGNNYPTIPQLLDFSGLQSINTNADLTLRWLPFEGGTANDYISVGVYGDNGTVFESPGIDQAGALDGTATSVVIPAGLLEPGPTFDCYLTFNRISPDSSSGVLGRTIYARETYAVLRTGGAPTVTIVSSSIGVNGLFQVQVNGAPNTTFTLEGTTGFGGWSTVDVITPVSGTGTLSDPATALNPYRFYRVKAG